MAYKVYFMFPATAGKFDPNGMREWVKWVNGKLGGNCRKTSVEIADLESTQPVFANTYNAVVSFEFSDQFTAFDSFVPVDGVFDPNTNQMLEILDRMVEFTDTAAVMQGCNVEENE